MALRLMPKSKVWAYQCKTGGKTFCRSTGHADRRMAEREVPRLQKLARLLREQPNASLHLSKAIIEEVARIETDIGHGQAGRVSYALMNFHRFAGDIGLERITVDLVEQYQRKRLAEVSLATVTKELCFVLRMMRLRGFQIARPSSKRGRMTPQRAFAGEEIRAFFAACPARLRTLYVLMLVTGARLAELVPSPRSNHVPLRKSEVDLERRTISIRSAKGRLGVQGKVRTLPLPAEIVEPLRKQMASVDGPFVFQPLPNNPRDFDLILAEAGIKKLDELGHKLTAHSFRHTYATIMSEAIGHNAFLLKEILGHKQISMTERYCHPTAPAPSLPFGDISQLWSGERGVGKGCRIVDLARSESA